MIVVPIAVIVVLAFLGLVPKNQAARLQVAGKTGCKCTSVLREWVLNNREVKNEEKMPFTLFEKCK